MRQRNAHLPEFFLDRMLTSEQAKFEEAEEVPSSSIHNVRLETGEVLVVLEANPRGGLWQSC